MNIPRPSLQIDFSFALGQIRSVYLQDALLSTVKEIDFLQLDKELATHVPQSKLKELASHGLRG